MTSFGRGPRFASWFASDGECGTCQECTSSLPYSLVHLHLNADALGTLNCWYKYASSHLSVFVIKLNFTSDGSQVRATAPMTPPDDMTRPSMIRVTSQATFFTVFSPHVQMNR